MKELSIEQKAKAYDEALKVLHKYDGANIMFTQDLKEEMFPELKESEDERVRKALINGFNKLDKSAVWYNGITNAQILAWLEKQGDANKEYWRGYWEGKQAILDKYAELEKQGEQKSVEFKPSFRVGNVIKPKDPVLGEPRIIKGIHPKFGYDTNNGILDFEFEDNWELVEQKPTDKIESKFKVKYAGGEYNVLEVKDIAGVTYYGIEDEPNHIDYVLPDNCETVSEQKHADKVNPKFRNGQWIVWQDKCYKVNYNGCGYELVDQNGLSTSLEYGTIDENAHIWDITKDAKDGDVLATDNGGICIFDGTVEEGKYPFAYCGVIERVFEIYDGKLPFTHANVQPATKEQRDQLKKAMADAGYTFDFVKKELKKM